MRNCKATTEVFLEKVTELPASGVSTLITTTAARLAGCNPAPLQKITVLLVLNEGQILTTKSPDKEALNKGTLAVHL